LVVVGFSELQFCLGCSWERLGAWESLVSSVFCKSRFVHQSSDNRGTQEQFCNV